MFYQNLKNIRQHNNRINTLPSVSGTNLRAAIASLKSTAPKATRYVKSYGRLLLSGTFCFVFMLLSAESVAADDWYRAPDLTDEQLESFSWLDSSTNCEVIASKADLAVSALKEDTFLSIDRHEIKKYAGDRCDLQRFEYYILARGLFFCCLGEFGVAKVEDKIVVGYSGLGKTPELQKSAVVIGLNQMPSEVFTIVFVSE
ncbi:hypothetical protein ISG33_14365 [Glaciecola sp. MH2013]|uniref:hypothetical protein n=1 Tax=Glaciecola sp. MH2013 TaxID=2785524 RepID=UPI00189E6C3C|nr:hypothetical protein [Glaciecola sp. MH2013]MBF7074586.1 hypothetical protein [Glaciecola sp. MH2013]